MSHHLATAMLVAPRSTTRRARRQRQAVLVRVVEPLHVCQVRPFVIRVARLERLDAARDERLAGSRQLQREFVWEVDPGERASE
jgi:hypothetical protein